MVLDAAGHLAVTELAIYIVLIFPVAFCAFKHKLLGALGWGYVFAFCSLRIIGSGLQISSEQQESTSMTSAIINGVGLSPLILGLVGILHESNNYIRGSRPFFSTVIPTLMVHVVVVGAMALVISGYKSSSPHAVALQKSGYVIFVIVYLVVALLTGLSWRVAHAGNSSKKLLGAVTISMPFLGVRVLYSFATAFDSKISAYSAPIGYRALAAVMEFFIVIIVVVLGVSTRNIGAEEQVYGAHTGDGESDIEIVPEERKRWLQARRA